MLQVRCRFTRPNARPGHWAHRAYPVAVPAALAVATVLSGCGSPGADTAEPTRARAGSSAPASPGSPASSGAPASTVPGTVPLSRIAVGTTRLASGLGRLTAIAAPDDGTGRLLLAEKSGTIRVFQTGRGLLGGVYLDLRDRVSTSNNERGLLGVATSPDFATTHTLVVAYTRRSDNAVTLSRFRLGEAGASRVSADTEQVLLTQPHDRFGNHNGGQVTFGPDGLLYWGIGDGGGGGDPLGSGQDRGTLLGKIMRVDVLRECGGRHYCVPADNPFAGRDGARPEIWAYGLRNPWRFSFDRADESLWIGDVGQNAVEEVDHLPAGRAGANLGWSCREGDRVFNRSRCRSGAQMTGPVFTYRNGPDGCAVQGGYVYRGTRFAAVAAGVYVLTDYCSATAWGIRASGSGFATGRIGELPGQPTTFGQDQAGELYLGTDTGNLYAITFRRR